MWAQFDGLGWFDQGKLMWIGATTLGALKCG